MNSEYDNRGDAEKRVDFSQEVNLADVIYRDVILGDDISVDGLPV